MKHKDIWTTPNILSFLRVASVPFFILILYSPGKTLSFIAAVLFLITSFTDWLDGYLARNYGAPSKLGRFLDPLADKLLISTCLIMLIPIGRAPAWMIALIVGREIAITGLRGIALVEGIVIETSKWGKYKTFFQTASITCLLLYYPFRGIDFAYLGSVLLWLATALTLWSGGVYITRFLKQAVTS